MSRIKQENGVTLIGIVVTVIVVLILVGSNVTKESSEVLEMTEGVLNDYNVSVILEEVELAMGELQMEYYYDKYINDNFGIPDTFGEYVSQKLHNEGIVTAKGKVISSDFDTVFYEDKNENKIAKGTFNNETGEIIITSLV